MSGRFMASAGEEQVRVPQRRVFADLPREAMARGARRARLQSSVVIPRAETVRLRR
ncbi:hypothetical protein A33M_1546 [Rhodovulum sp. PH10]|nr:hypothetical protein A33M_1546 [Rhodovulum sp. PH10]